MAEDFKQKPIKRWLRKETDDPILDADAFTRLYDRTHLIIFRYVYGLSGGPTQEAEDLTAETFARAWKSSHNFNGNERAALGWLLSIARNLAIDLARRRKVRNQDENIPVEYLLDPVLVPEQDVITREQIEILWRLLDTLAADVREMLVLRYMLGWRVKQIALYLRMNENNVSVTIRRALKSLHSEWSRLQEKGHE